jgi:hypothetical protein
VESHKTQVPYERIPTHTKINPTSLVRGSGIVCAVSVYLLAVQHDVQRLEGWRMGNDQRERLPNRAKDASLLARGASPKGCVSCTRDVVVPFISQKSEKFRASNPEGLERRACSQRTSRSHV